MSMARFQVASCPRCGEPWATEARHTSASCPRCRTRCDLAALRAAWTGDDAREAQRAAAAARAARHGAPAPPEPPERLPRHDSPGDAAAAQAQGIASKSGRAEAVALWMTRLAGGARHDELRLALQGAGLDLGRAEAEIVRMLACDVLFEPRAGFYRTLQG